MDVIIPFLSKFFSLENSGRIFIAITFFLLLSGTCALFFAVHRRISLWPLLAVLFLYNRVFLWGFLNYLFGIGVMLWLLAAWIYFSARPACVRITAFIIPTLCLFFSHMFALGIYGLCVAGYELSIHKREGFRTLSKAWGVSLVQFILPAVLFLFFSPTAPAATDGIYYGSVLWRFVAVLYPVLNYHTILDIGTALTLGGMFITGILMKRIQIDRSMYGPISLLFCIFWIIPMIIFSSGRTDLRIPIALAFILTAVSAPVADSIKHWRTGIALIAILFGIRTAVLTSQWIRADETYSQYLKAFELIKPGSRLFTAIAYPGVWKPFPIPLTHIPCLAIIERSAFTPSLFAYTAQQPVQFNESYQEQNRQDGNCNYEYGRMPEIDRISQNYDYFLLVNEQAFQEKLQIAWPEIFHGNNFRLLKVPSS
jgi:hypothetical protein